MKKLLILFLSCCFVFSLTGCHKDEVDYSIYTIDANSSIIDTLARHNLAPDDLTASALNVVESLIQGDFDEAFQSSYQTHSETFSTDCLDPSAIERYLLSGDLGDSLYNTNQVNAFILQNTEIKGTGTTRSVIVYLSSIATGQYISVEMVMTLSSDNTWLWNGKWASIQKINIPKDASLAYVRDDNDYLLLNPVIEGNNKDTYQLYLPIGELLFMITDPDGSTHLQSIFCVAGATKTYSLG